MQQLDALLTDRHTVLPTTVIIYVIGGKIWYTIHYAVDVVMAGDAS